MTKTLLTAVSAIAIMASAPAFADTEMKAETSASAEASTGSLSEDVSNAWEDIKEDTSKAASNVSDAATDVYNDAKQALKDDDETSEFQKIGVDSNATASSMIGSPVYNTQGERVAKVRDVILDRNGKAMMVVMADGDFTGLGKLVAFDYNIITTRSADGDIIAALSEEMIDSAASFSYDREEYSDDVRVIPSNGYSVSELMDGDLVDTQGESLADVENIVFRDGQADQIIVSFGQNLGVGGEKAAVSYGDADLTRDGDEMNFKLSAQESMQFNAFKKTALN